MDYSLSTFIPECGINPERLKKDEMLNKMGLFGSHEEYMLKRPMPLMYYIMYYFLEQVRKDPESVIRTIKSTDDFEKKAETILDENIATLAKNQEEDIPISGDRPPYEEDNKHMAYHEEQSANKQGMGDYAGQGAMKGDVAMGSDSRGNGDNMTKKRSYEYEERRGKFSLDDDDEEEDDDIVRRMKMKQQVHMDIPLQKKEENKIEDDDEYVPEEINEEIVEDVSVEQSNDKKSGSQNTQTISMSLGNDGTVDSHALDQYTYIEDVERK